MSQFDFRKYSPAPHFALANRQWPNRQITSAPAWCSVDLRDGNQALMEPMSVEQKLEMFESLVALGFKQIEVGFPSASATEFEFTRRLIEEHRIPDDVTIQVLVQAREHLIARTFEALADANSVIVHVYNSTSIVQRNKVFKLDQQGITDIAIQGAQWVADYAAKYPATRWQFQYSPESFTGTEMPFALAVCNAVIDTWAPTIEQPCIINLPATVEVSTPNVFADQIEYMSSHLHCREAVIVSLHTHNDRGCAVAAAELGLLAGADRIEGTMLGNGERTGNMDIITMAMNLYSQGINPELSFEHIEQHLEVFERCTQLPRHPRHPWVGELVFTAFSGSHQDAINKCLALQEKEDAWDVAYLPIDPEDLGRNYEAVIRVNSQSGKGGVAFVLERDFGLKLPRWIQPQFSRSVQVFADKNGGEINSQQLYDLLWQQYGLTGNTIINYDIQQNDGAAKLTLNVQHDQQAISFTGQATGALEALVSSIATSCNGEIEIVNYAEHALEANSKAQAICFIEVKVNGESNIAIAKHEDVLTASFQALLVTCSELIEANIN